MRSLPWMVLFDGAVSVAGDGAGGGTYVAHGPVSALGMDQHLLFEILSFEQTRFNVLEIERGDHDLVVHVVHFNRAQQDAHVGVAVLLKRDAAEWVVGGQGTEDHPGDPRRSREEKKESEQKGDCLTEGFRQLSQEFTQGCHPTRLP